MMAGLASQEVENNISSQMVLKSWQTIKIINLKLITKFKMLDRNDIYLQMSDQICNTQDAEAKQALSLQQQ